MIIKRSNLSRWMFSLCFIFIALKGPGLICQTTTSGELKIIAHYKERTKERIFATGNVEIHYKNIKLFADKIEIDPETKDVYAEGNVVLQLPEEVISAESMRFNLESRQGKLEEVYGMIQPTIFYEAESIERKDEAIYSFEKAKITSCTQPVPRWKFSCSRANFKKDKYVEMWDSVFSIKKVPVFYLPYMKYPLEKERATGFLMPQVGYSGPKGFTFTQGFYWAIRRNMDATFNLDYYSARGLGGGLEYRYLLSEGIGGQFQLFYFRFKDDPERDNPENAYILRFKHNQPLPFNFNLVADVDYQSSFDFLREFDNNFKRAVVSNRRSQAYLSRAWSYFNLNVRASRFETYFREMDNSVIRKTYPEIGFSSSKIKLFSPLYFSFESSFSRWEYGWQSAYEKGTQTESQNLSFRPAFTLPFSSIPWVTVNSAVSANFNYSFKSYAPNTKNIIDEPMLIKNYGFNTEFVGPVFFKIYFGADGEPKMKHIIEPTVSYVYDSPVDNSDRIITTWIFLRNHYVRYGLTNRFLVKKDNMAREIFSFGLAQYYYLAPEDSPLQHYRVDGEIPKYSDISAYMRFYPGKKYSVDFSAGFNPYYSTFSSLRLGANLGLPTDSLFLRLNWYKSINPYLVEGYGGNRHQISFFGGAKIPQLSLEAQVQMDFNIQKKEMLYSGFLLVYHYQCLDFSADFRVFYFREKPEFQFRINFGLGNIGKTTDFLGGAGIR
ncbi:MAG: LPS-assembly protein LptD [Candidatus Aminicenantes bacterium]|nr:LPS-assembly protein LptD [Candidatus Aminicenantes bacterium]